MTSTEIILWTWKNHSKLPGWILIFKRRTCSGWCPFLDFQIKELRGPFSLGTLKLKKTMQVNELKHGWPLRKCDWDGNWEGICSRFFENQPNEICSHLSEKASKSRFLNSKIIVTNKEKERRKRKSEEKERGRRKTNNGCTLSFYNTYSGDSFWPKKTVRHKRSIWR